MIHERVTITPFIERYRLSHIKDLVNLESNLDGVSIDFV